MPKTIEGRVADFPRQTQDWVANFSIQHTGGTMWLAVKTQGPNQAFAEKIREEVRQLKEEERSLWRIEYDETEKEKDGKVYTNRMVASAKIVTNTPTPAPAPAQQATSKDDSIARAVAFKGAIDLVAKKIGPKDVLLKCTDTVNALTDSFESILQRKYSQGSGDDAQLEVVDAGQDTLFDTDNPI
jgi:hypothetical protein